MMSETNDGNDYLIDDEDTQDDARKNVEGNAVNDTERPPSSLRVPLDTVYTMRNRAVEIVKLADLPSKHEVILRICAHANLEREELDKMNQAENNRGLSFFECRCRVKGIHVSYVYMSKTHKNPTYARYGDNVRVPMEHPGATVLFKVRVSGKAEEVYRWKD